MLIIFSKHTLIKRGQVVITLLAHTHTHIKSHANYLLTEKTWLNNHVSYKTTSRSQHTGAYTKAYLHIYVNPYLELIKVLRLTMAFLDGSSELQEPIGKSRLAMVNVGDN